MRHDNSDTFFALAPVDINLAVQARVAVVIPCYKVGERVLEVIRLCPVMVTAIYVVDDACPEGTGDLVMRRCTDPRVTVLTHTRNGGVGAAVLTGYRRALADGADVIVKVDGDGQMDAQQIPRFVLPILEGLADYTKGNRFHRPESLSGMPAVRLIGNAALSFLTKLSSGHYHVVDPTNGYTAIASALVANLPFEKINNRYFFESDLLFRLNLLKAVVLDVPMDSRYSDEPSSLKPLQVLPQFAALNARNFLKRVTYNYFVRDFNYGSVSLLAGLPMFLGGTAYGLWTWYVNASAGVLTPAGSVMVAAAPVLVGLQLLLSFINTDITNTPRIVMHRMLRSQMDLART